ncbi:MAG: hypothetical protein LBQ43_05315 [Holosporales bacterium]|nr:hypothetical protein [Holosporales bacterium]
MSQLAIPPKVVILRANELLKSPETEANVQPHNEKVIRQHVKKLQKEL